MTALFLLLIESIFSLCWQQICWLATWLIIDVGALGRCQVNIGKLWFDFMAYMHGLFKVSAWPIAQHSISDSSRAPRQRVSTAAGESIFLLDRGGCRMIIVKCLCDQNYHGVFFPAGCSIQCLVCCSHTRIGVVGATVFLIKIVYYWMVGWVHVVTD